MADPGRVVITGASRGLGLASAAHLHRQGWTVVAAVRSPGVALERLREATGAGPDDRRLVAVRLDLDDPASIAHCAQEVLDTGGAPDALVHNAGIAAVGCVEEMSLDVWAGIFSTNLFGPVRLTQHLLPAMRAAGRGRIVVVCSQGGVRGMPGISAYSAAKGALERWAEALSPEVAPFGLGVTVLVTGMFRTDILEQTDHHADVDGPYAALHAALDDNGRKLLRFAGAPEDFAAALARALQHRGPFSRVAVGLDARLAVLGSRLLPSRLFQFLVVRALGLPRPGTLRDVPDPHDPSTRSEAPTRG